MPAQSRLRSTKAVDFSVANVKPAHKRGPFLCPELMQWTTTHTAEHSRLALKPSKVT